jgi:hypothetical protein
LLGIYSRKLWYGLLTSTFYARRAVGLYRRVASNNSAD